MIIGALPGALGVKTEVCRRTLSRMAIRYSVLS